MDVAIQVDDTGAVAEVKGLEHALADVRAPLGYFGRYFTNQIMRQIKSSTVSGGGNARGTTWDPYKPYYTRRDGTVVPAWGGIPKVRGSGEVKGRKRHNQTRIGPRDHLFGGVKNAGSLVRRRITASETDATLTVRTSAAVAAAQNEARPFMFFQAKDLGVLERIFTRWFTRQLNR